MSGEEVVEWGIILYMDEGGGVANSVPIFLWRKTRRMACDGPSGRKHDLLLGI